MVSHPAPQRHGTFEEVFPDVFFIRGSYRAGVGVRFDRNMVVVRQGGELVVINSVRLDADGEVALSKLGTVKHAVRLGAMHGMDDPYYVERFGATLWAMPRASQATPAQTMSAGNLPLQAELFDFTTARLAEGALILPAHGGILVACDSYQNWTTFEHCSWLVRRMAPGMGFGPGVVGAKPWLKRMGFEIRADLERLAERPFKHLLSAHGTPLRDTAREQLPIAITSRFERLAT